MIKKERLFEIENIPINEDFITSGEKRKWTIAFQNWAKELWEKNDGRNSRFCCGYMGICELCKMNKANFCNDCVEAIKEWHRENGKPIPYRNYNFEEILKEVEK